LCHNYGEHSTQTSISDAVTFTTNAISVDELKALFTTHDPLTGLPARSLFLDRLEMGLVIADSGGTTCALLVLEVHPILGEGSPLSLSAADEVVREASNRLASFVRRSDTLARTGYMLFHILVSNIRQDTDIHFIAQKILELFDPPIDTADKTITVRVSLGICAYPCDGGGAVLVKNATRALELAKKAGANEYRIFQKQWPVISSESQALVTVE